MTPDPVESDSYKGQSYGARAEQEGFDRETQAAADAALASVAPAQYQGLPPEVIEESAPPTEPTAPNTVDLEDGTVSLDDILFGDTQRPDEPVTAGLDGLTPQVSRVRDVLGRIAASGNAFPDVLALKALADPLDI